MKITKNKTKMISGNERLAIKDEISGKWIGIKPIRLVDDFENAICTTNETICYEYMGIFLSREEKKASGDQTKYDFRIYKTDTLKSFQELINDNDPKYLFTEEELAA